VWRDGQLVYSRARDGKRDSATIVALLVP